MAGILIFIIQVYQKTISPDHSLFRYFFTKPVCRYTPTCSQYAIDSLQAYGIRSIPQITRRVLSCNPFSVGGFDPVVRPNLVRKTKK